ncbi:C2 domain-containing protein [Apiospora hydei]|uniref:C2 domain-containing protein n=1 Tax=Apiospora hydei TaxID=1337664 RepID=A0ABR1X508_9PEZI
MSAANGQGAVETNGTNGVNGINGTNGTNGHAKDIASDGAPTHPHLNPHATGGVNHEANFEVVTDGRRKRHNDAEEAQKEHDKALGKDENQIKKEKKENGDSGNKSGADEDEATAAAPSGHHQPKRSGTSGVKDKYKSQKDKIKAKTKPEGGFDATPVPDAPPGYTVKFTFHRATNLPAADLGTQASDPFCLATLTTSLPKRHKEDPNLEHRTPTIRKTLEPVWNDEWVVANVPASGFKLKVRLYDEDWPDHNDRLGNVTVVVHQLNEQWKGFPVADFEVKKRAGSKRAYLVKAATTALHRGASMTPRLFMSAEVLGLSDSPPHAHMYTLVNKDEDNDPSGGNGASASAQAEARDETANANGASHSNDQAGSSSNKTQKYDFQANEIQLQGPVPTKLYHRYVEFRPMIGMMFSRSGLRGRILHKHRRIYNFDSSTEYHRFEPCTEEASLQFLKLAHYDEGGRIFTYVLTLDGLFRFTETGKEFGIDLLSKHTMHSDVAAYIACSGEFLIRRLKKPTADKSPEPNQPTHPQDPDVPGGPPNDKPPTRPEYYQLVIDNDSGTYRPDKSVLPDLQKFLEKNFPGLGIVTLACDDDEDQKLKEQQREVKKNEGQNVHMVLNRSPSSSSFSSDDVSDLEETERHANAASARRSRKERMLDIMAEDSPMKAMRAEFGKGDTTTPRGRRRGASK